jgi:hypothetical protein
VQRRELTPRRRLTAHIQHRLRQGACTLEGMSALLFAERSDDRLEELTGDTEGELVFELAPDC